jgi:hypothetical protein
VFRCFSRTLFPIQRLERGDPRQGALQTPSTPRPTFTPAARYFLMGAMPDPRHIFEHGQCVAPQPVWANFLISSSSTWITCANTHHHPASRESPSNPQDEGEKSMATRTPAWAWQRRAGRRDQNTGGTPTIQSARSHASLRLKGHQNLGM